MSNVFTKLFLDSFVKGAGKTSGALVTTFLGWQMFKVVSGHDNFFTFILGKRPKKCIVELPSKVVDQDESEPDHEEVNLEDMENEKKFKYLFDKF